MKLTPDQIQNVAHLARLELNEAEKERMREELAPILTYFEILGELDTDHISPTAQVIAVQNLMRPDVMQPSYLTTEVLTNAPRQESDYFRVKPVLGETE
jgi:aspartyl-tRNA(Asn)/glutamyl-tRNA(Gln) amidotransferase subunit C